MLITEEVGLIHSFSQLLYSLFKSDIVPYFVFKSLVFVSSVISKYYSLANQNVNQMSFLSHITFFFLLHFMIIVFFIYIL